MKWEYEPKKNRNGEITGESWSCLTGNIRASIVKGHIHYRDGYVLHCFPLGIDTRPLFGETLGEIQVNAESILEKKASELIEDLRHFV